jgi:hypothetical protein
MIFAVVRVRTKHAIMLIEAPAMIKAKTDSSLPAL